MNELFEIRWDTFAFSLILIGVLGAWLSVRAKRQWFYWLRVLAYLFLIWMALEPSIAYVPKKSERPSLTVLVDVSGSMGIGEGVTRLDKVKQFLKENRQELEKYFDLTYFQFAQASAQSDLESLLKARPYGTCTRLIESVRQVCHEKKIPGHAILLLTDGADTSFIDEQEDLSFSAPVYTVGVGDDKELSDIVVNSVRGADFAFKGRPIEITASISHHGLGRAVAPVILKEIKGKGSQTVETKTLTFSELSGENDVSFRFVPQTPGHWNYQISVPAQKGEVTSANNSVNFTLEVGREKIRVLYLCGQPSPEYAFLRHILKSDPTVELVSFVILRNPEDVVPVPEEQLSLIQFPTHEIFVTTLFDFDLLIFENFSYARFGIQRSHLDNIQRFVDKQGGGFLMIGGENSFGKGGYIGTGIESILPVQMDAAKESVENSNASIKVLEPQHPLFDIGRSLKETEDFWGTLPPLNGYHRLPEVKAGASLLAVVKESGSPAIVGWQKGRGRVVALSCLSSWQWALYLSEKGLLQSGYTRFWRQMIRWLTSTQDHKDVRIVLTNSNPVVGEKIGIRVLLDPEKFHSSSGLTVQLNILESGKTVGNPALGAVQKLEYRGAWSAPSAGPFRVQAVVDDHARKYSDERDLEVKSIDLELGNPYPNKKLLSMIAQSSGGKYANLEDFSIDSLEKKANSGSFTIQSKAQKPLWNHPALFVLLTLILAVEWGFGRWKGGI